MLFDWTLRRAAPGGKTLDVLTWNERTPKAEYRTVSAIAAGWELLFSFRITKRNRSNEHTNHEERHRAPAAGDDRSR